jgi:hypothetical protein
MAGPRAGLVAAVLAALYQKLWLHDGQLMPETISIFAISVVSWSTYRFWDRPTAGRAAIGCKDWDCVVEAHKALRHPWRRRQPNRYRSR